MVSIAAITAFAGIAQADPGGCGCEKGGKHQRHDFKEKADKLGLTDAQKVQAKAIFQNNKDVVKPLFTSMHTEQQNLQALIHADTTDEAAIRAETAKIAGIEADLNINRAKVEAQFRAILTPAQLAILKTLPQEHPGKGFGPPPPAE
jgi:Spy/CpxP family protein refolding chaperone